MGAAITVGDHHHGVDVVGLDRNVQVLPEHLVLRRELVRLGIQTGADEDDAIVPVARPALGS